MKYVPDEYKIKDLIFPGNDVKNSHQYNLVEAKVLTNQKILLYIKKQGINLDRDDCCQSSDYDTYNAWSTSLESDTDLKEIHSHSRYHPTLNTLTYKFPVPRIDTSDYEVHHKLWIFDINGGSNCRIFFNNDDSNYLTATLSGGKAFIDLKIEYNSNKENIITCDVCGSDSIILNKDYIIEKINFRSPSASNSPAISIHWTYYRISTNNNNFSLRGIGICSYTNPCVKGYACSHGICEKCHPSCFDCINGGLSTDCESKCSSISTLMLPNRGSCPLGYVDLVHFEYFKIVGIIPPCRNKRLTTSFWFFLTSFPEVESAANPLKPRIHISYEPDYNFTFIFTPNQLQIQFYGQISDPLTKENTWYYVKGARSESHSDFLFVKYFNGSNFVYSPTTAPNIKGNDNGSGNLGKVYLEPTDYYWMEFVDFKKLINNQVETQLYIKELILFREYLPDPYDNKYFSYEKLFTSTFEMPEVLFVIPFDEMIKSDDKYSIKCYTYAGSILEYSIVLTPLYQPNTNRIYYPPKLFRPLNLLLRNQKYISPDLIEIDAVVRDPNTLIASYDNVPLSCIDNYFLTYESPTGYNSKYIGSCNLNCEAGTSMLHGISENKGFCNKICPVGPSAPICLSNNHDLLNLRSRFRCQTGYYESFLHCEDINTENDLVFKYDANQGPYNIVIDVINYNLKSYIIDFWMKPDIDTDLGPYLFYTNQFYISYDVDASKAYFHTIENRRTNEIEIKPHDTWCHYTIEVYYDPKKEYNHKSTIYFERNFLPSEENFEYSENVLPLEYIYFCNGRRTSCNNLNLGWNRAFYRDLRLLNGNLASRHVFYRYNEFYLREKYLLSSIKFYYPLYGHYIANNLLSQYNSKESALNTNSPTNNWNYPQYGYFSQPFKNDCPNVDDCDRCITNDNCYICKNGFHNFKHYNDYKIKCNPNNGNYVLRLPTRSNFKIVPLKGLKYASVTVDFFIKIYGFTVGGKIDVIYLGEKLKISYESDINSKYFGLNLITYKGDNEIVVSNYYNFRKHFGLWTFISVSVVDQTYEAFFPPMARFEINNKKMDIIGSLENLSIGNIYFSEYLIALVQRLTVYNTYLIGTNSFEMYINRDEITGKLKYENDKYLMRPIENNVNSISYFSPVNGRENCLFSNFGITATDKENPDIIISDYECELDELDEIYHDNLNNIKTFFDFTNEYSTTIKNCRSSCDGLCTGNSDFNCSCNFRNNHQQIFLGNVSNHYCKKLTYINFAKMKDITIPNVKNGKDAFTLHFWVFAYSYIDKVFQGISIEWQYHTTIRVGLDSAGKYYFTCLINGDDKKKYVDFKMNEWNFLHCSVNYPDSKFYIASENRAYEYAFTYEEVPKVLIDGTNVKLIIRDLTPSNVKDWGVLFYRYIRVWSQTLRTASFLSRIKIDNKYFGQYLLHQWDTSFSYGYYSNKYHLYETKPLIRYNIEYSNDTIGTNIVDEKIYQLSITEPTLCNEEGQYFDRKIWNCVNFVDISNSIDELTFENIDVAYSHNYAMAFWILLEDHKDITQSLDFIWEYHMQISLQYSGATFKAYCFPQNYYPYSDIIKDETKSLEDKTSEVLNSATNEYTDNLSGIWTWFECSLTYNNRYFYLNENKQDLITETLYKEGNTEFKNDEPLGHFFNDLNPDKLSTVTLVLNKNKKEGSLNKKIYLRCFYLFKDFLPYNYDFKYMDMSKIGSGEFPPLTLAINFASFEFQKISGKIKPEISLSYSKYTSLTNQLSSSPPKIINFNEDTEFALASNFVFLPLCNPKTKEKYNAETSLCQEITLCDETELKAKYCMGEKTPLVCYNNYYINIDTDGTVECLNYCKNNKYFRSPGTHPSTGICGTDCLPVEILKTCPNSASAILTYQSDFECKEGYNRIGYQCLAQPNNANPNEGALFYSGINYPYNIYRQVNTISNINNKKYVLEFWFMIDNVIYTNYEDNKPYYYFYAFGHQIYLKKLNDGTIEYHYRYGNVDEKIELEQYEWNKILIFVNSNKIKLVINFNKIEAIEKTVSSSVNNKYILFCSNTGGGSLNYPNCPVSGFDSNPIKWASAYYNNIRIWNSEISTIDTIQSFINKIYLEYPHSLLLFYPLTIKYLDNNQMTNIMKDEEHITFVLPANSHLSNKDNIIIYNYSTKFDWGLLHKKQFVNEMTDTVQIDPNDLNNKCNEHCLRCFKTDDIEECYECEEGYVLQYKECKDARKLYFLKTPSGTSGASVIFKTINKDGKDFLSLTSFTIVFWMKFFGVKYGTTTENCKIMSIDANTYLAYKLSNNHLVMIENSKTMFDDDKFINNFGIWIPISIANYISNQNNDVYPNMFTLSINKRDIPFKSPYSLPDSGIKITEFSLGYEIIALFAELSIYSKFIQGGYGRIRSLQNLKDQFFYKSLTGTKPNDCLVVEDDLSSDSLICAPDYSVNFIDSYYCKNDNKFYAPYDNENNEKPDDDKCGNCNDICETLCFDDSEESCTCDLTDGIFWLRRNNKMETYCEHIYYLDFSNIDSFTFDNSPVSKTQEYTIEFWVFIYSYNLDKSNFKELYLEWNYHNKMTLFDDNNSLKVNCQPIWRSHDFSTSIYSDVRTNTLKYYSWNYVRCGTDLKNRKYFSNTNIEYDLRAKKDTFFDFDVLNSDSYSSSLRFFKIYRSSNFLNNFGFVFIKEIKLWQQYNIDFLDTKNIYFDMNQISKEQLKKNFPGLLQYYQNDFNLTKSGNSVIKEQLTGRTFELTRSPDYIGYNIVDPKFEGNSRVEKLEQICSYGHVYNNYDFKCECVDDTNFLEVVDDEGNKICMVISDRERDALCEAYSNKNYQCLTCKENNQFLNKWTKEFPLDCYNKCPPTLYEDPLINQCRKCHPTCYECTNEFYNNCTSCTGVLYFNFKDNTCIPNCQTAELTRSLTKPNICVVFDAGAELVNVGEEIPIDVNNFFFIEAKVIQPTSSEYETWWLFDVEKTNLINEELGLFDDIKKPGEHPFTSERDKLNVTLNHTFFKTEHKYVFCLKIYAENKGLEVPVYVYWTLTMNSAPYGGRITTMPNIGLYNTTTFIIRCVDYQDENTPQEELLYDFYYIEQNTNMKIKLSRDFSTENEVYSNFTVRFYQLEYSNISVYCVVKDKWGATSQTESVITIVNNKHSELYNLKQIVSTFYLTEDELSDKQLLARSEVLMSLGINPYNDRMPETYYTTFENSLTGEKVIKTEPQCVTGYCNNNGQCEVIDIALTCKCNPTHVGKQCFLDKNGYADLASWYKKMFRRIMDYLDTETLNDNLFYAIYKLFFSAQNYYQNSSFFEFELNEFRTYLKNELIYITQNEDSINKIIDLDIFYLNYFYVRETQTKLTKKINEGYLFRNKTLTQEESLEYKNYFEKFFLMLDEDTSYIIKNYQNDYRYTSQYFNYYLINIDENFNDEDFFESLKTVIITYKPTIQFMKCLKEKYSAPFNYYLNYIEYLVNPLSFDNNFYPNITSPYFSIKIYDSNGEEISISDCSSNSKIKIKMPFTSYDWINYINEQKWLFLPENYKLENDPVFRDPILINKDGSISDDTVEERIKKYYRYYNIVGLVYTPNRLNLYEYSSLLFKNITDAFFLIFETNHLSGFSSMLIPNPMKFIVDGRFFYIPRYMVLFYLQNHLLNPVFYINFVFFITFFILFLVFKCKDFNYFDELETLDFLIKEIYKNNFGYDQIDPGINDANIYKIIHNINKDLQLNNKKEIRDMFDPYEFGDIKEEDNENDIDNDLNQSIDKKNDFDNKRINNIYNMNTTTGRKMMTISKETNIKNDEEYDIGSDKQTEIKTNKRRKNIKKRISNKNNNKYNVPPKRKNNNEEEDSKDGVEYKKMETIIDNSDKKRKIKFSIGDTNKSKVNKTYLQNNRYKNNYNINKRYDDNNNNEEEDFDEDKLEQILSSEKSSNINGNKPRIIGFSQVNQNYDLDAMHSKLGFNASKYSKFSKVSSQSKKSYFVDKDNTRVNQYISIEKFHNKSYKLRMDKNIINDEEEKKKALDEYTRLNNTTYEFFKYNLKTRHILLAPFLNLTLYHNRWKKIILLLTQFFLYQLSLSILLTSDENILLSNISKMLMASLISVIISNILIHTIIPFFSVSFLQRKKLYRLAEKGQNLYVSKIWRSLKRTMNIKIIFALIIIAFFWIINFYITLGFTAVWKVQRSTYIVCFILCIFIDLAVFEIIVEGIVAFVFSKRKIFNLLRNFGEIINRYRSYRTLYP